MHYIQIMRLNTLPRIDLTVTPTPLQPLPNLTKLLSGPKIFVKRDDLTGLAFGGNKARKLEYLMGDALQKRADIIVTGAGFHSNWCTQTASAASRANLPIILIKSGPQDGYNPKDWDGNHLLHHLKFLFRWQNQVDEVFSQPFWAHYRVPYCGMSNMLSQVFPRP